MARGDVVVKVAETGGSRTGPRPYRDDEEQGPETPVTSTPSEDFDSETEIAPTWYRRASSRLPSRLKRYWNAVVRWTKGPQPPRHFTIRPILPAIQHAPLDLVDRIAPKTGQKAVALMVLLGLWILSFGLVLWRSNAAAEVPGYGAPSLLSCTSSFWSSGNGCGLNGDSCRPFSNATMAFRCPASCAGVQVLDPHAVGSQEIVYQSLTIGGPTTNQTGYEGVIEANAVYRGDSFICAAAVHAGFISDSEGGCGVATLTGEQMSFTASMSNGIQSIGFDSYFPLSFAFLKDTQTECRDLWWPALIVSVFFSSTLSLFTKSPVVFFWSVFVGMFLTVGLATNPPYAGTFYGLLSTTAGRFLPAAFTMGIMYRFFIKRTLTDLTAQIEKTILWLGPAWVGALNNYTFDQIPLQRLTPHDIKAQPGALTALIIIVLIIIAIAIGQAWAFRLEGRMPRYLGLYGLMGLGLLILLALPGVNLRIHHYILALLFIPGTSFQNRVSLVYQGLLFGLFVNGIARWDFDSIIQTPDELFEGSAVGSLLPDISVLTTAVGNITLNLGPLPVYDENLGYTYDGFSILVNDVEHFHGYEDELQYWPLHNRSGNFTWSWSSPELTNNSSTPEYFRFAYLSGSTTVDYTKAGTLSSNGTWTQMEAGPS